MYPELPNEERSQSPPDLMMREEAGPSETCFVLLVEDDHAIRETLRELLNEEGFTVIEAGNGLEALALLEQQGPPCLILLDLMMPVMDGWRFMEVARPKLREDGIPLTVLSAVVDQRRIPEGVRYLRKPVDIEALLGVVTSSC